MERYMNGFVSGVMDRLVSGWMEGWVDLCE